MHKASFCLQAEKSVHLNNYVLSYPAGSPEYLRDRRTECRKDIPASALMILQAFSTTTPTRLAISFRCSSFRFNNIFHNRVFLNKLIVKSKLL